MLIVIHCLNPVSQKGEMARASCISWTWKDFVKFTYGSAIPSYSCKYEYQFRSIYCKKNFVQANRTRLIVSNRRSLCILMWTSLECAVLLSFFSILFDSQCHSSLALSPDWPRAFYCIVCTCVSFSGLQVPSFISEARYLNYSYMRSFVTMQGFFLNFLHYCNWKFYVVQHWWFSILQCKLSQEVETNLISLEQ